MGPCFRRDDREEGLAQTHPLRFAFAAIDNSARWAITAASAALNLGDSNNAWSNAGTIDAANSTVNLGGSLTQAGLGTFSRAGSTVNLAARIEGLTKLHGAHSIRFGTSIVRRQIIDFQTNRGDGRFNFDRTFTTDPNNVGLSLLSVRLRSAISCSVFSSGPASGR